MIMDQPAEKNDLRILLLEDVPSDAELTKSELQDAEQVFTMLRVDTREAFVQALDEFKPNIVLADYNLPAYNGRDALEYSRRTHPHIPVIMVTGAMGDEAAVEMLKLGARDYVLKDRLARLVPAIKRALSEEKGIRNRKLAEGKYKALFTEAMDGIVLVDCDTWQTVDCNPEFEKQTGRTLEQLMGMRVWELLHPEQYKLARQRFLEVRKAGSGRGSSLEFHRPDGVIVPFEYAANFLAIQQRRFIQCVTRDITERKRNEQALQEEKAFSDSLIHSLPDIFYLIDQQGKLLRWSRKGAELLGRPLEEMPMANVLEFIHEEDRLLISQKIKETFETGSAEVEARMLMKTGIRNYILTATRIETPRGVNVIGVGVDITERKQAEASLQQERDFSDGMVDTAQVIILLLNPQGQIVRFNRYLENLTGYSLSEVKGKDWFSTFLPESEREATRELFRGAIRDIQTRGNVSALLTKDGQQRLIEWYDKTLKDAEGNASNLLSIGLDVTERKKAEEVLRKSKDLLQSVVENVPARIFWKDRDSRFLGCNTAFAKDAGCASPEELTGITDFEMGWKDQAELYRADDKAVMEAGNSRLGFEELQTTPDGNTIWLRTSKVPLRDANNQVIGVLGIYDDITERKQSEEALLRANRALKTLSAGNLALVRAANEDELLRAVTNIVVEQGGYIMSAVGYAEDDPEKSITPMAWSGMNGSDYWIQNPSWADTEQGQLPIARAIRSGTTQICHDIASDPAFKPWKDVALARGYVSNIALPLSGGGKTFGGLSIYSSEANAFDDEEVQLLEEMANDLAYGIITLRTRVEHEQHATILRQSLEQSIQTIADTVEARDPYTAGHQRRVGELATAIAREMGLPEEQVNAIHLAAIIHDLGKIKIPAEILNKPGKLSDLEYLMIKTHPQAAYDILKDVKFPWPIASIILQHHEKMDGSGYPQGLKGDAILLEARILTVADVVEAMSSHRPYRPGLGVEAALEEITRSRGTLFDPRVVDACVTLFRERGYVIPS